jgi:hypothetical protein
LGRRKRTPAELEAYKERCRSHRRKQRLDPEFRAKERADVLARYHANKEKYRRAQVEWKNKNRERINEERRIFRRDHPDLARQQDKRNRATTIKHALARIRDGTMGLDELNKRINKALIRLDDRVRSKESK